MNNRKLKIFLIIILILVSGALYGVQTYVTPVDKTDTKKMNFAIAQGELRDTILNNLVEDGLIKSTTAAKLYVRLSNNTDFKTGVFELSKSMSMPEIIQTLNTESKTKEVSVTYKEGLRVIDFASVTFRNLGVNQDTFKKLCNDENFIKTLKSKYSIIKDYNFNKKEIYQLEGLLAPNTYNFAVGSSAETVIDKLVAESDKIYKELKSKIDKSKFNLNQVYTLASMVEREANSFEDRKLVASIFANRLDKKIPLGSDVTTYYGLQLDMSQRDLTEQELAENNGYNTRSANYLGLPIGPIAAPSTDSLKAVLEYKKTDYLYFVSDKNGKIYATKTNAEHDAKINELKDQGLWFTY